MGNTPTDPADNDNKNGWPKGAVKHIRDEDRKRQEENEDRKDQARKGLPRWSPPGQELEP